MCKILIIYYFAKKLETLNINNRKINLELPKSRTLTFIHQRHQISNLTFKQQIIMISIEQVSELILSKSSQIQKVQIEAFKGLQSSQNTLIDAVVHILKNDNSKLLIQNQSKKSISKSMSAKDRQQIVFERINQMVLSAEPRFIHKINNDIFNLICQLSFKNKIFFDQSAILQNYVLLWSRIFNGSQQKSDYPNAQQTFSKLIKQKKIKQYKQLPIAYKNSIWTFEKVLAQRLSKKVEFFDDVDEDFSFVSEEPEGSVANQIVYMDANQIKQIRQRVQQGAISQQTAAQFLIKARNFLQVQRNANKKKKQLKDKQQISIIFDYNEQVKWASHFVSNYESYINENSKEKASFVIHKNRESDQKSRKIQEDFYDQSLSDNQSKKFQIPVQKDTFYSQKNKNPFSKLSYKNSQNRPNYKNSTSPDFKGNVLQQTNNQRQHQIQIQNRIKKQPKQICIQIGNKDEQMIKSFKHNQTMSRNTKQGFSSTPKKKIQEQQIQNKIEIQLFRGQKKVAQQSKRERVFDSKNGNFQQRWFRPENEETINVGRYSFDPNIINGQALGDYKQKPQNNASFIIDQSKNKVKSNGNKNVHDQIIEQEILIKKQRMNSSPRYKTYENKVVDEQVFNRHYSQASEKKSDKKGPSIDSSKNEEFEHFEQDADLMIVKHKPNSESQSYQLRGKLLRVGYNQPNTQYVQIDSNHLTPIKQINNMQDQFSKSRSFYNNSPGKFGGSSSKKLSQFSQQKKARKHFAPMHQISQAQEYVVKPYFSHFSDLQNLARFRRNCFEQNLTLYSSASLLIICSFRQQSSNGTKVQLQFRNQSKYNLNICSIYKIPRCFQIEKKSKIQKKFILTQRPLNHVFNLKLRSFPLDPCLLSLQYGYNQEAIVEIPMPITIRNFVQGVLVSQDQWIGLWQQYNSSQQRNQPNNFKICKHTVVDRNIIQLNELSNVLRQCIELGSIQGYSVKQFGGLYQYPSLNEQFYQQHRILSFLIRFSLRVQNIVSLELLAMRRVSSTQKDLLQYYINSLIMLLTKIDV